MLDKEELANMLVIAERDRIRKQSEEKYKDNSKKRLLDIVAKKFKTTMIGSLAKFEENFGFLWGHGKNELTEQEAEFRKIWDNTRTEVLNNGNNQLRAAQDEIANHSMAWDGYKTEFIVKPKTGTENE